jgi:hypothetical protein
MVVVQYIIQFPNQGTASHNNRPEDDTDGCFHVPAAAADNNNNNNNDDTKQGRQGRITLKDLRDYFPFEGRFHFRARVRGR